MRSLPPELREKATIYKQLHDPTMPEGRWNPADQVRWTFAAPHVRVELIHNLLATYGRCIPRQPRDPV